MRNLSLGILFILFVGFFGFTNDVLQVEKSVWKALYSDDHQLLERLLVDDKAFFDNDEKRVGFSKIGQGFIHGDISLSTLKVMHQHGFDLNDLKPVKVSFSVQEIIREFGVDKSNVDIEKLPTALQQQLRKRSDLTYYDDRNYDPYYLERFAKYRSPHNTMANVTWLLENGYTSKPIALGYVLAEFIAREDYHVTPDDVETLHSFGMLISMEKKENMIHRNYVMIVIAIRRKGKNNA